MCDNKLNPTLPVLYLDYDGVLHPDAVYWCPGRGIVLMDDEHQLFESTAMLEELLAPHPSVQLVLSTDWVRTQGFSQTLSRLPTGLQARVVGTTWNTNMNWLEYQWLGRYAQITQHAAEFNVSFWLAIDNNADGWPTDKAGYLVRPHDEWGLLQDADAQQELRTKLRHLVCSCNAKSPNPY